MPNKEQQKVQKMEVDEVNKSLTTTPTKMNIMNLEASSSAKSSPNIAQSVQSEAAKNLCMQISKDVDSGIENMETSDTQSPVTTPQTSNLKELNRKSVAKSFNERLESMISKILNATWNEYCTGSMICPQTASFLEQHPHMRFDFETLVSNVLTECVLRLYNDEDTLGNDTSTQNDDCDDDAVMKTGAEDNNGLSEDKNSKNDSTPTYSTPKKIKSDDTEVQEIMANAIDEQPSTSRGLQTGKSWLSFSKDQ